MAAVPDHPDEDGAWTRLEGGDGVALWQRERATFASVIMRYVIAPPQQTDSLYDPARARERHAVLATAR